MSWGFKTQKKYALIGLAQQSVFFEQVSGLATSPESLKIVANVQQGIVELDIVNGLFAGQRQAQGDVYISLPLNNFETVNLTINKIPDGAVGKVLPYHLEKALDEPVQDFIYDWQITKRKKDSLAVSVILFPRDAYQRLEHDLKENKLTCKSLEPDIYSAAVYLEENKRISSTDVNIIMLVHETSISIGVYELGQFTMIRPISLSQPAEPFARAEQVAEQDPGDSMVGNVEVADGGESAQDTLFAGGDEPENILADFLIPTKQSDDADFTMAEATESDESGADNPWQEYFNQVRLELMRTRDYYHSMIKGDPVSRIFVGCHADLFQEIKPVIEEFVEIPVEEFLQQGSDSLQCGISQALGIGVLS